MAQEQYFNVPRDVHDVFYAYKMPRLRIQLIGDGSGIRTNIANMARVAQALRRPPEFPLKFFGLELGALTRVDWIRDIHLINGKYDVNDLQQKLDLFIEKYVLCGICRYPSTEIVIKAGQVALR